MTQRLQKKRSLLIAAILGVSLFLICKIAIFDNPNVLFTIAGGADVPSKLYYISTERIYKMAEKKDLGKKLQEHLEKGQNEYLHNEYIKTLGIIGEYYSTATLIKAYSKYQHNTNRRSTVNCIIDSMGSIGNEDVVPLLETLLKDYDELDVQATGYSIARALYLITGKEYSYVNSLSGESEKLYVTDELTEARSIIVATQGRRRSLEEMIKLDKIYRPPGW